MSMKRVVIESPLSGNWDRNIRYAKLAMVDSFRRKEAPYASHLLYPFILNDEIPFDRKLGMAAGFAWGETAELAAVYIDLGELTPGMRAGVEHHQYQGTPVEFRHLPADLMALLDNPRAVDGVVRATQGFAEKVGKPTFFPPGIPSSRGYWRVEVDGHSYTRAESDAEFAARLHGNTVELTPTRQQLIDRLSAAMVREWSALPEHWKTILGKAEIGATFDESVQVTEQ